MKSFKTLEQIKEEVNPEMFYRPRDIADRRWINNGKMGKSNYYYILKLIKCLKLKAVDFGLGKTQYFRIRGSEILRYLESFN